MNQRRGYLKKVGEQGWVVVNERGAVVIGPTWSFRELTKQGRSLGIDVEKLPTVEGNSQPST